MALEGAQDTLRGAIGARESEVAAREQALSATAATLNERETALAARAAGLEESIGLAKDQLLAANQRAERLEAALADRDAETLRLRSRIESAEALADSFREKHDAATALAVREQLELRLRTANALESTPQAARKPKKSASKRAKKGRSLQHQDA
jgi:hypothetical protein